MAEASPTTGVGEACVDHANRVRRGLLGPEATDVALKATYMSHATKTRCAEQASLGAAASARFLILRQAQD